MLVAVETIVVTAVNLSPPYTGIKVSDSILRLIIVAVTLVVADGISAWVEMPILPRTSAVEVCGVSPVSMTLFRFSGDVLLASSPWGDSPRADDDVSLASCKMWL